MSLTVASLSSQSIAELMFMCFPVTCYVQNRFSLECLKYCAFSEYPAVSSLANFMMMEITPEEAELNSLTKQSTVHLAFIRKLS